MAQVAYAASRVPASSLAVAPVAPGATVFNIDYHELTFLIALIVLNVFVFWVLRRISLRVELREVIAEKDPVAVEQRTEAIARFAVARTALLTSDTPAPAGVVPDPLPTSYSRLAGVLGTLVLVATLWALANFVTWAAFWDPARLAPVLETSGDFFLAGSALFAPYAFNQLSGIFKHSGARSQS